MAASTAVTVTDMEEDIVLRANPNFSLNRVGSLFPEQSSPGAPDATYYSLGSIGRLCNEVDDITLAENESSKIADSSTNDDLDLPTIARVPTAARDTPVFSWIPRTSETEPSLEVLLQQSHKQLGSSLAPQSTSDPSDDVSEAPSVGQFRPGMDLMQCPVPNCVRTFKWKKNLHHHIRDKHPHNVGGISTIRPQVAVGPVHTFNGYRLNAPIAPQPVGVSPSLIDEITSLRCAECGKSFARKGDLVHHKRYHTRSTDRPYKCEQCGQGFIHHKDLARHMPRHTGQRSFQCPFQACSKTYTRKDNLNRHMRHDHGGLDANGAPWTGVEASMEQLVPQSFSHGAQIEPPMPIAPELAALRSSSPDAQLESSSEGSNHPEQSFSYRATTPSTLGKRAGEELERFSNGIKPKRKPKEKWAHRLGCPFRKCRQDHFTTDNGFRVCETTPHEFIIRLIEHMKRNHELYVCGECFHGFDSPDWLNHHKDTTVHCGKCYLSFPSEFALQEHSKTCMTVDVSTQEDIWQIMYETLCADGIRHNPSFDDDSPVNQHIESNNRVRMQFVAQQPLLPGQVPSLSQRQIQGVSSSGNGSAPLAPRADGNTRQQLVPAGANSYDASSIDSPMPIEDQLRQQIGMLQSRVMEEERGRVLAETRVRAFQQARIQDVVRSAVTRLRLSARRPRASPITPAFESEDDLSTFLLDSFEGGSVLTLTPARSHSVLSKQSPVHGSIIDPDLESSSMRLDLPQSQDCPSLLSISTAQSQDDSRPLPAPAPPPVVVDTHSTKQTLGSMLQSFFDESPNFDLSGYCQNCWSPVEGPDHYCGWHTGL